MICIIVVYRLGIILRYAIDYERYESSGLTSAEPQQSLVVSVNVNWIDLSWLVGKCLGSVL